MQIKIAPSKLYKGKSVLSLNYYVDNYNVR